LLLNHIFLLIFYFNNLNCFQICLKRPKLRTGAIPIKRLKISDNLIVENNSIQRDHTCFKLKNTPDSQSYAIQHTEVTIY